MSCNPCPPTLPVRWALLGWLGEPGPPVLLLLEDGSPLLLEDGGDINLES